MPGVSFEGYKAALNKLEEAEILKAFREQQTKIDVIFWEEMRKTLEDNLRATVETQKAKRW